MKQVIKRLQAFSDAVLAIAAIVLAVPLAKVDETTKLDMYLRGKPLSEVLGSDFQLESFAMFLGSFIIVYLVWVRHGRQFSRLSREELAGDTPGLIVTNMVELFLATLLPYTAASAARARLTINYDDDDVDRRGLALPFCANVFALATARVVFESLALRARHSLEAGFFNLVEAVAEMLGSMLVLALASSVLVGEEIFLPFLAVPLLSVLVRACLINRFGDQEFRKMDWHRLEGFVDGCIAVVGTLMVLEIRPPVDCSDMKFETCVLHFADGCRVKLNPVNPLKPPLCFFEREDDQSRDIVLIAMYFVCFFLMVLLWYVHHEVIHQGYMLPKRRSILPTTVSVRNQPSFNGSTDNGTGTIVLIAPPPASSSDQGAVRSLVLTAWFCASIGLFPFAFALVTEFSVEPFDFRDPRLFPQFEDPLDPEASRTACFFALGVVLSASLPVALMLMMAPRRSLISWALCVRVFAFQVSVLLNATLLATWKEAKLWPMFLLVVLLGLSGPIGRRLQSLQCCGRCCSTSSSSSRLSTSVAATSQLEPLLVSTGSPNQLTLDTSTAAMQTHDGTWTGSSNSVTPPTVASYRAATPLAGPRVAADYVILSDAPPVAASSTVSTLGDASNSSTNRNRNRRMSASQEYFSNFT